jgi:hypothetical protein
MVSSLKTTFAVKYRRFQILKESQIKMYGELL